MKYRSGAIFTCLVLLLFPGEAGAIQRARTQAVTIGIVTDGPYQRHRDITQLIRQEILDLLAGEFDVRFPDEKFIEADFTAAGIERAVEQQLADPDVDLVLTLGPISSHLASQRRNLPKPIVAPIIIDAELQQTPRKGAGSGVENLTYIALPQELDIEAFLEIVPFTRLAILAYAAVTEAIPELPERLRAASLDLGLEPVVIPVGTDIEAAIAAIGDDIEAVYVLPLLQISEADFDRLVEALIDRRLPSFAWMGQREVLEGIMAGRKPDSFIQRITRRLALNIQRILLGEEAADLDVSFAAQARLTINMATARAIGVYPPWKVITEAELIADEEKPADRRLTLASAVQEAVDVNLDLAARDRAVAAGAQDVNLARAELLPQIDLSADGSIIDEDRAQASFGSQPERQFTGSATLTQLIYAEPAWANLSVQRSVQEARELDRETLGLDIAFDAAVAYLNVLRAKTLERVQKDNLNVTRVNLELAQVRQAIGSASPGEVYRWENEIANNRQAVINASAQRNLVEIELNRLLHRPLEEPFATDEADITDEVLISSQERLYPYIDNRWNFQVFREFMAQEARDASPELRALASVTAAQRRALSSAERAFYLPSLALQASVTNIFSKEGAGSEPGLGPGLGNPDGLFPEIDDFTWSVGFSVQYPLLTGGARFSGRSQAAEELAEIEIEREAVGERVEQRVRAALHQMGSSLAAIDLSRDAAEAAANNFELVQDSYSRGLGSIIDLLDAQNAALIAEEEAANAIYDFLIDLMSVERAVGRFDFFMTEEEIDEFFERLDAFFEDFGPPRPRR